MNMYTVQSEPRQHMCKVNSSRDGLWWVQPHSHTRRSNNGNPLSASDWCTYLRKRKRTPVRILRQDKKNGRKLRGGSGESQDDGGRTKEEGREEDTLRRWNRRSKWSAVGSVWREYAATQLRSSSFQSGSLLNCTELQLWEEGKRKSVERLRESW